MEATNGLKETARVTAPVVSSTLNVNVFTAPGKAMVGERPKPFGEALGFDPITSTLIFGDYDAVLVDAMGTVAEAEALADWVALHDLSFDPGEPEHYRKDVPTAQIHVLDAGHFALDTKADEITSLVSQFMKTVE